jgi:hypothetical protein
MMRPTIYRAVEAERAAKVSELLPTFLGHGPTAATIS